MDRVLADRSVVENALEGQMMGSHGSKNEAAIDRGEKGKIEG